MKDIADLIGRIFLATIFLYEAYDSIGFFNRTKSLMTEYGIHWQQDFLLIVSILVLIIGGTMVLIGYYANVGAFLLFLYWFPLTFILYSFWNDPSDIRRYNSIMFMRNLGISGALLLLVANGAQKYSVKRLLHVLRLPKD